MFFGAHPPARIPLLRPFQKQPVGLFGVLAKSAGQEPGDYGRHSEDDDVDSELGQHGVTGDEDADAEIDDGCGEPDPNEQTGAVHGRPRLALIDLRGDENKQRQQDKADQSDSKRVHLRRKKAVVGPNMFER